VLAASGFGLARKYGQANHGIAKQMTGVTTPESGVTPWLDKNQAILSPIAFAVANKRRWIVGVIVCRAHWIVRRLGLPALAMRGALHVHRYPSTPKAAQSVLGGKWFSAGCPGTWLVGHTVETEVAT